MVQSNFSGYNGDLNPIFESRVSTPLTEILYTL